MQIIGSADHATTGQLERCHPRRRSDRLRYGGRWSRAGAAARPRARECLYRRRWSRAGAGRNRRRARRTRGFVGRRLWTRRATVRQATRTEGPNRLVKTVKQSAAGSAIQTTRYTDTIPPHPHSARNPDSCQLPDKIEE